MHKRGFFFRVVAVAAVGAGGVGGACSSFVGTASPTAPADAGSDAPSVVGSPGYDAGTDAGSPHAKLILVDAVTDLGPAAQITLPSMAGGCANGACDSLTAVRVCFAVGADANTLSVTPLPALPDTDAPFGAGTPPGIYSGTGGVFPDLGIDLGDVVIQPYVMNAASLFAKGVVKPGPGNPGDGCDSLVGKAAADGGGPDGGTFTENVDYWKLPLIPAGSLRGPGTYVLALTGCTDDVDPSLAAKCGPAFTPTGNAGPGNLTLHVYALDSTTPVEATAIGTQFIQSSPQGDVFFKTVNSMGAVPVQPGYVQTETLAGTVGYQPVTTFYPDGGAQGGVELDADVSALVSVAGVTYAFDSFTPSPQPLFGQLASKLTDVSAATFGPDAGLAYNSGGAFTFIMIGDPAQTPSTMGSTGVKNPRLFHFLGFPNDPPVVTYKP